MNYFLARPIQRLLAHKFFYLWLAEIWTLVIAFLCLVSFKQLPTIAISGADKYVHFILHLGFTVLWFLHLKKSSSNRNKTLATVFLASIVYGILTEIAQQLFTTTRKADIFDVMANTSGAIVAVLLIMGYYKYVKIRTA